MTTATNGLLCDYCEQPADGDVLGDTDGQRAAAGHPDCARRWEYGQRLRTTDLAAHVEAQVAARIASVQRGAPLHPDDEALLDAQVWTRPSAHPHCDRCKEHALTIVVGGVDQGSGGGYDYRWCRACTGPFLTLRRIQSAEHRTRHVAELPRW